MAYGFTSKLGGMVEATIVTVRRVLRKPEVGGWALTGACAALGVATAAVARSAVAAATAIPVRIRDGWVPVKVSLSSRYVVARVTPPWSHRCHPAGLAGATPHCRRKPLDLA